MLLACAALQARKMGTSLVAKENSKWNQSMKRICAKEAIDLKAMDRWWRRNAAPRVEGLIDVAVAVGMAKEKKLAKHSGSEHQQIEFEQQLFIDVSQDVDRKPWSCPGLWSVTTSSEFFSIRHKRALLPIEHYLLLGFGPLRSPQESRLTPSQHRDLSSEAMSPPVVALAILAVLSQVL